MSCHYLVILTANQVLIANNGWYTEYAMSGTEG
jgi:hypothetical protein